MQIILCTLILATLGMQLLPEPLTSRTKFGQHGSFCQW